MTTSHTEESEMKSEHYHNGYQRGKALLGPMHHNLDGQAMKDYLDGFLVGQAEAITRRGIRPPMR